MSRWYQDVLGLVSGHGGPEYEMLFEGTAHQSPMVLQLHRWDAHEHGFLGTPDQPRGNGVSLWFQVSDEDALGHAWDRAGRAGAQRLQEPSWNPQAHHRECTVLDPEGYVIAVCTPFQPG